jgi:hypothetical protein
MTLRTKCWALPKAVRGCLQSRKVHGAAEREEEELFTGPQGPRALYKRGIDGQEQGRPTQRIAHWSWPRTYWEDAGRAAAGGNARSGKRRRSMKGMVVFGGSLVAGRGRQGTFWLPCWGLRRRALPPARSPVGGQRMAITAQAARHKQQ